VKERKRRERQRKDCLKERESVCEGERKKGRKRKILIGIISWLGITCKY
jgi:hypothetical protein